MLKTANEILNLSSAAKILAIVLLLVVVAGNSSADKSSTDGTTPSVITPGAGSYPLSGLDNINLFNGTLNFSLPLMRIGGRGEAGYTMMLPIESHWRVINKSNDFQEIYLPTDSTWYAQQPGYGPGLVLGRAVASNMTFSGLPCVPYVPSGSYRSLTRLTFILPGVWD